MGRLNMIAAYAMPGIWRYADIMTKPQRPATDESLTFIQKGRAVTLNNVPPHRTLLQVLREDLEQTAVKEGCAEGDCGACTVVVSDLDPKGRIRHRAINSCISLAHAVSGKAVWTASDIGSTSTEADGLHPAQQSLVDCHGSQCGFCTPGFVMSLYGIFRNQAPGEKVSREQAQVALSGNLCRCTGYRPILEAAGQMGDLPVPPSITTREEATEAALRATAKTAPSSSRYSRPETLLALLQERSAHPEAQIVAGTTDVGLWITKQHRRFDRILDVTGAAELRAIETYPHHLAIGAGVTLSEAFAALGEERPDLQVFFQRFAGLPVRNAGTLAGNVANGSPIGDSMPLLIALRSSLVLMRWDARRKLIAHRELAIEDFYTGYRQNVLAPDEIVAWIKVPRPAGDPSGTSIRAYKVSKRFDDDISAVCLAVAISVTDGLVSAASIGAGGVAATPVRARETERALVGKPWTEDTVELAVSALREEFKPISDMRASAGYRQLVLGNLLTRFWLEAQPTTTQATVFRLEDITRLLGEVNP